MRRRETLKPAKALLLLTLSLFVVFSGTIFPVVKANAIIQVPKDYPSIQKALNAALPGDTVQVANGTYRESVLVTKGVRLVGASIAGTIINATGTGNAGVTIVETSQVSVQNFTVVDYDFFNSSVLVDSSSQVSILDNKIESSPQSNGTYVVNSTSVTLRGNTLSGNLYGIALQNVFGSIVQMNNSTGNAIGIRVSNSQGNKITDNAFRKGSFGVRLTGSVGNVVARNLIANNSFTGLSLEGSFGNMIVENNIDFNNATAPSFAYGIYVSSSQNNRIFYNNVRRNGIQVWTTSNPKDTLNNIWNDTAPTIPRGNFWSDYNGTDPDLDGVGDTKLPHPCPNPGPPCSYNGPAGVDYRPLMLPYVPPSLTVTATANSTTGFPPLVVSFTGIATGGLSPYTYRWDFGDGTTLTQQNVTHAYTWKGTFISTLTVNDTGGTIQSDSVGIAVVAGSLVVHVVGPQQSSVAGANVTFLSHPTGQAVLSEKANSLGVAAWGTLRPGSYTIGASSPGFSSSSTTAFVHLNQTTNVQIILTPAQSSNNEGLLIGLGVGATAILAAAILVFYNRRGRMRRPGQPAPSPQ